MTTKSKVPHIRFKGFCGEWEEESLGELATFSKGQGYSKNDLIEIGTPIILYGRLYTKYQTTISLVDTFVKQKASSIVSKGNEIIVPASGETAEDIARASAIKVSGLLIGGDLNIIYPDDKIDNIFLALSISNGTTQKNLSKKAQGKSVVHLRNNDLKEVDLLYPSKMEQTKIGDYFQKLDKLIEQKEKKYQKLKQFKKAMLSKMFSKNGATTPEIRFKGFSGEWVEKKLGDIAIFIKGKGISKADVIDNGQMLCVRYGELYTAYNEVITTIYSRTNSNIDMVYSQENDILMPTSDVTPRGLATASALSQSGIILGGDILIIRSEEIVNSFFSYFVSGHKNKIIKLVSGTTVFHLYAKDIENLYLHLPSKEEQTKIGNYFQKLDTQIDLLQKELEKLKNIKKASLSKMFV